MPILSEGARLANRYTLIRRLSAGAVTEVWLADDVRGGTRVALKCLVNALRADPARIELLAREWRISSRLMHANIIRVFEYHDEPDGAFFAMQFVGESSIALLCGEDPAASMRPMAMLADALRYAHGKGVIHRDIKAANILLDSRGIPYLCDFGVAATSGSKDMAASGTAVASSPQQLAGEPAGSADDIFAFGILLHELLTGAPPSDGRNSEIVVDGRPVPPALSQLIAEMLARDPQQRPEAAAVADRLAAAGFPPGPAPARFAGGERSNDEVVESIGPITRRQSGAAAAGMPDVEQTAAGLSPNVLIAALATAVLALLAVVFLLPRVVAPESESASDDGVSVAEAPADAPLAEPGDSEVTSSGDTVFNENAAAISAVKAATDNALGDLLSQLERLRYRAVERWGGQAFLDAVDVYGDGDKAYIDRNYRLAGEKYRQASQMLEPFFARIDTVFKDTLAAAKQAFEAEDHAEAVRLFDLAVAITPGNREAEAGLERARNLRAVLSLVEQGKTFESDLELDAAKQAFEKALQLDAVWQPAIAGLARVRETIRNMSFEQRMTEGFESLAAGNFASARAAFNAAKALNPGSSQPADGLLQVDQEVRLADIRRLESDVAVLEAEEKWESAVAVYENILNIDPDLQFAREGLSLARSRAALHEKLDGYISAPDSLSDQVTMQNATTLLLDLSRMDSPGPRITDQKNELSRLLKRAATPLEVRLISDNLTDVSILKVGRFGNFSSQQVALRPGRYIAVGIRPGYRDVRVEFRVAPEIDLEPIVVQTEEPI